MIYGQNFESYCKSQLSVFYCWQCGKTFSDSTVGKMDRECMPCPCGVQVDDLAIVDTVLNPELADQRQASWDEVIAGVRAAKMWRCKSCGFTGTKEQWGGKVAGDESWTICPRCDSAEDYDVLGDDSR